MFISYIHIESAFLLTNNILYDLLINCHPLFYLQDGIPHAVTQFHYLAWPDHGVPTTATPLLNLHRKVLKHVEGLNQSDAQNNNVDLSQKPTLVHCRLDYIL